jgi:curved DNA-binding protein CbpA
VDWHSVDEFKDYYEVLGVEPDASAQAIREAYRNKVQILHGDGLTNVPESVGLKAQKDLIRVNRAYRVLRNSEQRSQFHSEWAHRRGQAGGSTGRQCTPLERSHVSTNPSSAQEVQDAAVGQQRPGPLDQARLSPPPMSWFQRHLHWTYLLGGAPLFLYQVWLGSYTSDTSGGLLALPVLMVYFGVGGWVLKQKERSLWWLLACLVPLIGPVAIFLLGNEKQKRARP